MVFLSDFDKISMEILCNFCGVSMIFYGVSKGVSVVVLWDSYGVSRGCLLVFLWIPMGFLWYLVKLGMTKAERLPEDSWEDSIRIWRKTNAERQALRGCCGGLVDRKVHSKRFTASAWKHSKWNGGHMQTWKSYERSYLVKTFLCMPYLLDMNRNSTNYIGLDRYGGAFWHSICGCLLMHSCGGLSRKKANRNAILPVAW